MPFCSVDSATILLECARWKTKEQGESLLVRFERAGCKSPDLFGIAVAQKLDGGRGVVKVYRIFCLIVVICNVWILTIPLHVEFLCYVAIFTLSCFIPVFISYFDFFRSIKRRYKCSR